MLPLLHPAVVHFPVAFLVTGGLVEAWGLAARREGAARFGAALVVLGVVTLVVTVVTGYLAANAVSIPAGAEGPMDRHEKAALALLALWIVLILAKAWNGGTIPDRGRRVYAAALVAGAAWTAATAFLGGQLVYGWGVGVPGR